MSGLAHFADSGRTSPEVRQVPILLQKAAIRLAGDLNAKVDESTLDELLVSIKAELIKLGPLIDLEAIVEEQRRGTTTTRGAYPVTGRMAPRRIAAKPSCQICCNAPAS
jgi:hypothetical protein